MRKKILIVGAEFHNQGAYLMLRAAVDQILNVPDTEPVLSFRVGTPKRRRAEGARTMVPSSLSEGLGQRFPLSKALSSVSRFVDEADLYAVLDASGFRYGDQWAHRNLRGSASRLKSISDRGIPVYMLPQALGPFERSGVDCALALRASRVVYARDRRSAAFARDLLSPSEQDRVLESPDFTCLVEGKRPSGYSESIGDVPIVPNWNIMERAASTKDKSRYIDNLVCLSSAIRKAGYVPFGLCHEGERDREILSSVQAEDSDLNIVGGWDGQELKYVLGNARFVVAGRFHAAVSALTQGVPVIIHGWSHKYQQLAEDFGILDLLADPYGVDPVGAAFDSVERALLADPSQIHSGADRYKMKSIAMWDNIWSDLSGFCM